jgi:hypothetical protein
LLAANIAQEPLTIEFHGLPSDAASIEALFESRNLPLTDGRFQDAFDAYEVHVYKAAGYVPPPVTPLSLLYLPIVFKASESQLDTLRRTLLVP